MRASSVEQIIIETLEKEAAHLTSHQVYASIRERLPAVNPSTVYRALDRLAGQGKVSVSDMGTGSAVYEMVTNGPHHHLVCSRCGYVQTIKHQDVDDFFKGISDHYHFQVITNHLILFGVCQGCCAKEEALNE